MKWENINGKFWIGGDKISTLRSEKYIIVINTEKYRSKVLQIIFHNDGSIFITFPYFEHTNGIVSLVTIPPNLKGITNLSVLEGGKATSHLVKYSYHPDGKSQFSQDGKVYTKIRKQCPPINEINGSFFTTRFQDLSSYDQFLLEKEKIHAPLKRTYIEAVLEKKNPPTIKISGLVFKRDVFQKDLSGHMIGPTTKIRDRFNKIWDACVLSAPIGHMCENINMVLTCEVVPRIDRANQAHLSFMGGYDERSIAIDKSRETSFLFFAYPLSDTTDIVHKIGSIDFRK